MIRILALLFLFQYSYASEISGGIDFGKPKMIKIKREDLVISPNKVTVNYVFKNSSALDMIETLIFEVPTDKSEKSYKTNLSKLELFVNGKAIDFKKEIRAYNSKGIEISFILEKLNLPKEPLLASSEISERVQFDHTIVEELDKYELLNVNKNAANWDTKTFYHWQQKFPSLQEVHVKQVYTPSVKISPGSLELLSKNESKFKLWLNKIKRNKVTLNDSNIFEHVKLHTEEYDTNLQHFCFREEDVEKLYEVDVSGNSDKAITIDKFKSVLNTFWDKHAGEHKFLVHELSYGLLKDAHWAGPIENFTLRIEYPNYLTPVFCWKHDIQQRKSSLLSQVNNFLPNRNLNILFFEKVS